MFLFIEPGSNFSPYGPNKNLGNKRQYIDGKFIIIYSVYSLIVLKLIK